MEEQELDSQQLYQETPVDNVFIAPSINARQLLAGNSYTHYSSIPAAVQSVPSVECVLGVDEAGRGPVLGPMVYGVFFLPIGQHTTLLADTHHFDDSKVLTPATRSSLMQKLCTPATDLHTTCGWATTLLSARSISSSMLQPGAPYNLNAQAMDATIALIQGVLDQGVNVTEVYVDTIGSPAVYQKKLERVFPTLKITVAKKADSLYPVVSAASVVAKVSRDAALETCWEAHAAAQGDGLEQGSMATDGWGSGYPSDARCSSWLKQNMDPVFGWGAECRFSWGTAKDLLDGKDGLKVDWPVDDEEDGMKMTDFFAVGSREEEGNELANWYGRRATEIAF